jgi:hypothetical protein
MLSKSTFVQSTSLQQVTDIVVGELDPSPGEEIGIAGTHGVVFADANGQEKASLTLPVDGVHVDIVDVEGDGVCEFIDRGMWWASARLMDHRGRVLWSYGQGGQGVDDMGAGDVDGDGVLEFAVGFNGSGGVHLLDSQGQKLWQQPDGNAWHVEIADTDGDGKGEIINSNAGGRLTVRDASGRTVKQGRPPAYFSAFSLCRWPTKQDPQHAVFAEGNEVFILRFDASVAQKFAAPNDVSHSKLVATPVILDASGSSHLAALVRFELWNASVLYVYDSGGSLVYHEVLADTCAALASVSLADAATETLLVGGTGKVWRYDAAAPAP